MTEDNKKTEVYQITVVDRKMVWTCRKGLTLAESADKSGKGHLFRGCHGGGCGVCKVLVLEGSFERKKESSAHITEDDKSANIVLACCAKPNSDLSIEIL